MKLFVILSFIIYFSFQILLNVELLYMIAMSCEESTWSCARCSFDNHPDLVFCEMCEGARVNADDSMSKVDAVAGTVGSNDTNSWSIEKTVFLMDDCSCTAGIMDLLKSILVKERTLHALTWPHCSHFSQRNSFGASWSCGYRNVQMISSALMQIPAYREKLYSGKGRMPNIRIIQQWIEEAWKEGFDTEVCSIIRYLKYDNFLFYRDAVTMVVSWWIPKNG